MNESKIIDTHIIIDDERIQSNGYIPITGVEPTLVEIEALERADPLNNLTNFKCKIQGSASLPDPATRTDLLYVAIRPQHGDILGEDPNDPNTLWRTLVPTADYTVTYDVDANGTAILDKYVIVVSSLDHSIKYQIAVGVHLEKGGAKTGLHSLHVWTSKPNN